MAYWVKFINKNKFAQVALDKNIKDFVAYINSLISKMIIYLAKKDPIALLLINKVIILAEYLNFVDIFLKNLVKILPK